MEYRTHYRTVVLSDIHLGTSHSKVSQVNDFLSSINCDRLILNGDIIDGWHLKKIGNKEMEIRALLLLQNYHELNGEAKH